MTQMDLSIKQTYQQTSSCQGQGEGGGGMNWEFWINRCKLLYR